MEAQNATHASEYFKEHSDAPLVIPEEALEHRESESSQSQV
jgi:hypothetical protein